MVNNKKIFNNMNDILNNIKQNKVKIKYII